MSTSTIADRYARAIFELGEESGSVDALCKQIGDFAHAYSTSQELRDILESPVVEEDRRRSVLLDVAARLGLSETARNAVQLLAARRRLRALSEIAQRLDTLADERRGVLRATVISAKPLPESYYQKLVAELERATNKKISLDRQQDESLIAGVITRIGDNTIDGSLRGRLASYGQQLLSAG